MRSTSCAHAADVGNQLLAPDCASCRKRRLATRWTEREHNVAIAFLRGRSLGLLSAEPLADVVAANPLNREV
jgi:hypothetical protein